MSRSNRFDDGEASALDGARRSGGVGGGTRQGVGGGGGTGGGYRDRGGGGGYGSSRGDDRGGGGGSWRSGGAGGGSREDGGGFSSASSGQRPRLNLKPRTVDGGAPTASNTSTATTSNEPATTSEVGGKLSKMSLSEKGGGAEGGDTRPRREPAAVNSRAAAFGSAPEYRHSDLRPREGRPDRAPASSRGPPPVANKRIAVLAEEERERDRDSRGNADGEDRRAPRGPPPVASSRFAAAAAMAKDENDNADSRGGGRFSDRGPPPTQNSRFAAAAAADSSRDDRGRGESGGGFSFDRDRGPPPAQNSRFAAAAAADEDYGGGREDRGRGPPPERGSRFSDRDRGPPPAQNSRFAAAAAADEDYGGGREDRAPRSERGFGGPRERDDRGGGRGGYGDRDDRGGRGGGYGDRGGRGGGGYGDRDDRGGGRGGYGDRDDRGGGRGGYGDRDDRGGGRGGYGDRDDRGGRGGYGDRDRGAPGGGYGGERRAFAGPRDYGDLPRGPRGPMDRPMGDLPRGPRTSQMDDLPRGPRSSLGAEPIPSSKVDELVKPIINAVSDNVVKVPKAPEHEANMLAIPAKALTKDDDEDLFMKPTKKPEGKPKEVAAIAKKQPSAAAAPVAASEEAEKLMAEFASGNKKGEELKAWVQENRKSLPRLDKLVFALLMEQEKLNPDPKCGWAEPKNFGAALLSLVEDDIVAQMHVLWGIQFYCDKIGFPKLNDEYIVQAMFRGMYQYDLAEWDAFMEWKDDETEAFEQGKLKAIIQTVDWFTWLAEIDDGDEEEGGEDEEEEE